MSMKFPASIFSMSFCGTGGTSEKLSAVKLILLTPMRIEVLLDVGSGHCAVTVTCCRAHDEGITFSASR